MTRKTIKETGLTIRLTNIQKQRLEDISRIEYRSLTDTIIMLIDRYYKEIMGDLD